MPTVEAGTETREMQFGDQIGGRLKNTRFCYKVKGNNGYWGRQPVESTAKTDTKHVLLHV